MKDVINERFILAGEGGCSSIRAVLLNKASKRDAVHNMYLKTMLLA
jgi:hypothetical protein